MSIDNEVVKTGFSSTEVTRIGETASSAVAAQAKAMIESRYTMAMRNPRNMDQVRQDLIKECRRPSFANNKSALYKKPIGKGVEGLGIRFVEVALRCMKNVLAESVMVYDDDKREIHRGIVTDLESNNTWTADVNVSKTVERSKPMDDGSYVSVRKNSYKQNVYTVPAYDDELLNKRLALISKAIRTLGLRLIPGDLQDEAEEIIRAVRLDEAAKDPDAERKRLADAFAGVGVKATDLQEYLGHALDSCTPAELVDLRGLYGALKDEEATWVSVMENKRDQAAAAKSEKLGDVGSKSEAPAKPTAVPAAAEAVKPAADVAADEPGGWDSSKPYRIGSVGSGPKKGVSVVEAINSAGESFMLTCPGNSKLYIEAQSALQSKASCIVVARLVDKDLVLVSIEEVDAQ